VTTREQSEEDETDSDEEEDAEDYKKGGCVVGWCSFALLFAFILVSG
jgi:hypothetical protein